MYLCKNETIFSFAKRTVVLDYWFVLSGTMKRFLYLLNNLPRKRDFVFYQEQFPALHIVFIRL